MATFRIQRSSGARSSSVSRPDGRTCATDAGSADFWTPPAPRLRDDDHCTWSGHSDHPAYADCPSERRVTAHGNPSRGHGRNTNDKLTMKERFRKQKFLKNIGLQPNKNKSINEEENENSVCERLCFYYFDDDAQVICRGCYKSFKTWLNFRMHFNTLLCHTTEANYKLNTYNDVYKKYKLRKAKTKKRINGRLSAAQLMDLETLNTRKTRKRCYTNTRVVVNVSKSPSDSGSTNSVKIVKIKKEALENLVSNDVGVEEVKPNMIDSKTVQVQDIPNSTKTIISNLPHDNQATLTIKTEWNADDISQASSDDQSSNSAHCLPKYGENKDVNFQYVCVICDEHFSSKCLLTMHQVQHIKSDRSSYGVFMAALARSA